MANPFEDENGVYHVLVNDEGQHSLWPSFIDVPQGLDDRPQGGQPQACLDYINRNWTDMRPRSLIEKMEGGPRAAGSRGIRGGPSLGAR